MFCRPNFMQTCSDMDNHINIASEPQPPPPPPPQSVFLLLPVLLLEDLQRSSLKAMANSLDAVLLSAAGSAVSVSGTATSG